MNERQSEKWLAERITIVLQSVTGTLLVSWGIFHLWNNARQLWQLSASQLDWLSSLTLTAISFLAPCIAGLWLLFKLDSQSRRSKKS